MKNFYLVVLIILLSVKAAASNEKDYGLFFKSYEKLPQERTGLMLENGDFINIKNELTINFEIKYRAGTIYGSALEVYSESSSLLTLGYSDDGSIKPYPIMIINDEITPINDEIKYDEWLNVSLKISKEKGTITLKYRNITRTVKIIQEDWKKVKICFGRCQFPQFESKEVPPIVLKNIRLTRNEKLIRHWKLNKHSKSICYDEIEKAKAIATNPDWIIDSYTKWGKKLSLSFNSKKVQYTFDPSSGIVYIVPDEKTVIAFDPISSKKTVIAVKGGRPAAENSNQLIYNQNTRELLSYNLEKKCISTFSFSTQKWSGSEVGNVGPHYWHHTAAFRPENSSLITFGGYGFHLYKNDMFIFSQANNEWQTIKIPTISPRYSATSVILNDTLFVFGGQGNASGRQEVISKINTDLYAIDLKTLKVTLLWEMPNDDYGLPCGNMVYNAENACFYLLTNSPVSTKQTLLKISKYKPEIQVLPSNFSIDLNADYNFYTLMKPEKHDKIYALFCRNYDKEGMSKIDIYSISYPPIALIESQQNAQTDSINFKLYLLLFFVLLIISGLFLMFKKYKNIKEKNEKKSLNEAFAKENEEILNNSSKYFNRKVKAISLLGLFNIRDKEGNDITNQFTPILKSIILAVVLNSDEKTPGINSKVLDYLIWPNKEEKSARNNRNVSMNRLNTVLEQIGDVQINNNNSFWKLNISDDTLCDYLMIAQLMKVPKNQLLENKEQTAQLLELLSFGQLLPFSKDEWLDPYKAAYSDFAINFLLSILTKEEIQQNMNFALQIANLVFLFDLLCEEALIVKCKLLYKQGKKSLAKNAYTSFCKEYENLLGETYATPLSELIESR